MNASYLPELCMKEISIVLKDNPAGLFKCSLLNRHWCQYFLPELWKNPFAEQLLQIPKKSGLVICVKPRSKILIETFLLCLSPDEKKSIQDLTITANPYLMYSEFLQILDLSKLVHYIGSYDSYPVKHHLQIYKLLCYHFVSNSTNISKIIFSHNSVFNNNTDLFLYSNAKNLSTLKEIEFHGISLSGLIFNCYKICRDLQTVTFYSSEKSIFNERYTGYNLKNLIKSQKNLKNLNIYGFFTPENKYLYEAVNSQTSSLRSIKFRSIHLNDNCTLDYLVKCENLEELQILDCKLQGNIIIRDNLSNFQIKPKLKYLKFENCVQTGFFDNCSLIISILGQNLQYLHIRGEEILSDSRNIGLLSVVVTNCGNLEELQILKCNFYGNVVTNGMNGSDMVGRLTKLRHLKLEDCTQKDFFDNYPLIISKFGQNLQYLCIRGKEIIRLRNINLLSLAATSCSNLKIFKVSIFDEHIKYISTLFSSCQKLHHVTLDTYRQRDKDLINIDLSEIGKTMPLSMKKFTMKMNLYFTPENFKEFLINIKNKNLEVLNFKRCKLLNNDHLNMLIKYGNGSLKRLKIHKTIKVDNDELLKVSQFVMIENQILGNSYTYPEIHQS